jgi:hypothetical protein
MFAQSSLWKKLWTYRNTDNWMNERTNKCLLQKCKNCLSFVLMDTEWWVKSRTKIVLNLVSCRKNPTEFYLIMFGSLLLFTSLFFNLCSHCFLCRQNVIEFSNVQGQRWKICFIRQGMYLTPSSVMVYSVPSTSCTSNNMQNTADNLMLALFTIFITPWSFIRVNCPVFFCKF